MLNNFTITDAVTILTILGGIVGLLTFFDKRRAAAQLKADKDAAAIQKTIVDGQTAIKDDMAKNNLSIDHRVTVLEGEARQFIPKSDIEKDFEHEKKNRVAADESAATLIKELRTDVTSQGREIAKLEQNDGYLTSQINDLKTTIDKGFSKMTDKIDKLCDGLAALDKKVS